MQTEQWKPIPGYGTRYEASTLGRIRSFARGPEPLIRATATSWWGYKLIPLAMDRQHRTFAVHRLIALVFLGPPRGLEVNHKNGIKTDNRVENLEYVTRKENLLHRHRVLGIKINRGMGNGRHKLNDEKVREIRRLLTQGFTATELGKRFSVSAVSISYIHLRRTWKHI